MIDALETGLVALLRERMEGQGFVGQVSRPHDLIPPPVPQKARVMVRVSGFQPAARVGDDEQELLGQRGAYRQRPVLRLEGEIRLDLTVAEAADEQEAQLQRGTLLGALDQLLLALHPAHTRNGADLRTEEDRGFALDGLRFARLEHTDEEQPQGHRHLTLYYAFSGRFWPVGVAVEGVTIQTIPSRTVVVPLLIPDGLLARAGGSDLQIPITADLRPLGGAVPGMLARLRGARPPGELLGDPAGAPAGWILLAPATDGERFHLLYRPPSHLTGRALVQVELALGDAQGVHLPLGSIAIAVEGR